MSTGVYGGPRSHLWRFNRGIWVAFHDLECDRSAEHFYIVQTLHNFLCHTENKLFCLLIVFKSNPILDNDQFLQIDGQDTHINLATDRFSRFVGLEFRMVDPSNGIIKGFTCRLSKSIG